MRYFSIALGVFLVPVLWVVVKLAFEIDDRYLPSPIDVIQAAEGIEPAIYNHLIYTWARLVIGSVLGIMFGLGLALALCRFQYLYNILMPSVQSMRAVPPMAMVPFFLLWFGFSEEGKFLLIVVGIGFNVAVAAIQIASDIPEKYRIFFKGIGQNPNMFPWSFVFPRMIEALLPTVRFSVATATGLVVVAELLGSQIGLGYLIQSARSTFATHTIFLAAILLGVMSAATDAAVRIFWQSLIYWDGRRDR